jgi:hypothetical protein
MFVHASEALPHFGYTVGFCTALCPWRMHARACARVYVRARVGACAYFRSGETGSFRSRTHLRFSPCAPTPRQRMSHGVCARWTSHKSWCRLHGAGCARSVARPMCVACGLVRMHASFPMLDVAHVGNRTLHGVRCLLHVAFRALSVQCVCLLWKLFAVHAWHSRLFDGAGAQPLRNVG